MKDDLKYRILTSAFCLLPFVAAAQSWPAGPIRIVFPSAAGRAHHILWRQIA